MKILAIAGSARAKNESGVYKLVETVAEATGLDCEIVHLRGKKIGGCTGCLGCADDNVCVVRDDLYELREKIVEADAYIVGGNNYFSTLNGITQCLLERWYQFRHRENDTLWGKLGVAVGVAGMMPDFPADAIERYFLYNFIEPVAKVTGQGAAGCFTCGYGEDCAVGAIRNKFPEGFKITEESTPCVQKQADVMQAAKDAGAELARRLTSGHNREESRDRARAAFMEMHKRMK
jgi:multimeric flavodoxin WrbA